MAKEIILYKFRPIDKFAIDILVNHRLHFADWETLNDPQEAKMRVIINGREINGNPKMISGFYQKYFEEKLIKERVKHPRVCSLSKTWKSNLLWSHYADGHTGIAIGIKFSELPDSCKRINVAYDDIVPLIQKRDQKPLNRFDIEKALRHKSAEWRNEEEIRLVTFDSTLTFLPNVQISEICFGERISNEDRELIYRLGNVEGVTIYHVLENKGTYELSRHVFNPSVRYGWQNFC